MTLSRILTVVEGLGKYIHPTAFEFKVFTFKPVGLPTVKSSVCPTIIYLLFIIYFVERRDELMLSPRAFVWSPGFKFDSQSQFLTIIAVIPLSSWFEINITYKHVLKWNKLNWKPLQKDNNTDKILGQIKWYYLR